MDGTNVKVFLDEWSSIDEYRAMKLDAERYRKLRANHWSDGGIDDGVLIVTRAWNVPIGSDCPSEELLDAALDKLGDKPC